MTTTSVKNVGNVMNLGVQNAKAPTKGADGSFQTVWNSQTSESRTAPQEKPATKSADQPAAENAAEDQTRPGDEFKAQDGSQEDIRTEDIQNTDDAVEELTEEEVKALEEAMEVIMSAVTDLVRQIADTFGISVEDVQRIMADMELKPMDLLQPEKLSSLLLEAGGAQDSLSLLTNEQLYADYQMLMEQGKAAMETSSEALNVTPEQFAELAVASQTESAEPKQEPFIEIVTEGGSTEQNAVQPQSAEDAPEDMQPVQKTQEYSENDGGMNQETDSEGQQTQGKPDGAKTAEVRPADGRTAEGRHTPGDGNLVLQTMKNEVAQVVPEETAPAAGHRDVDTQDVMRQIMDFMRIQVKPDVSSMEMQLHPANLGTLQIQVAVKSGVLTANFITQNEAVKAALESQMVQLKESFEEQGVKVEAIEVTVQTHQFEQNLEQGKGRQFQEQTEGRRSRTRRINLNGLSDADLSEELEAQDRITAEMMAANGATVDFTA